MGTAKGANGKRLAILNYGDKRGYTLRKWRVSFNITQSDLAKRIGVSKQTYSVCWERHPEKIPIGKALMIAEIFGCALTDIKWERDLEEEANW